MIQSLMKLNATGKGLIEHLQHYNALYQNLTADGIDIIFQN